MHLGTTAMSPKFKVAFAFAFPFLEVMGDVIMAWMLLWRAALANQKLESGPKKKDVDFYEGQLKTAEFFIQTIPSRHSGQNGWNCQVQCRAAVDYFRSRIRRVKAWLGLKIRSKTACGAARWLFAGKS